MSKKIAIGNEVILKQFVENGTYFTPEHNAGYTGYEYKKIQTIVTGIDDKFLITKKGKFHKNLLLEVIDNQLSLFD